MVKGSSDYPSGIQSISETADLQLPSWTNVNLCCPVEARSECHYFYMVSKGRSPEPCHGIPGNMATPGYVL